MSKTKFEPVSNPEIFRRAIEMQAIGNVAVRRAQAKNREQGIPNYYSLNGLIVSDEPDAPVPGGRKIKK